MQICLVGSRHYNTFGSHGSASHVPLAYFATLHDCYSWLKNTRGKVLYAIRLQNTQLNGRQCITDCAGCEIIGVEITESAVAVNAQPFSGNTAFMLGNEVRSCHDKQ